jgi:hypothetical protein
MGMLVAFIFMIVCWIIGALVIAPLIGISGMIIGVMVGIIGGAFLGATIDN